MVCSAVGHPERGTALGHSHKGVECPSWLFWRGEKHPEPLPCCSGDGGKVCAPSMSQVSLREGWQVGASFSASYARALASRLSLIFIHLCNSHQGISTRASNQQSHSLWGQGQGNLPSQLWENGNACGAWLGRGLGVGGRAHAMRPNLIEGPVLVFDRARALSTWERRAEIRPQEQFWP